MKRLFSFTLLIIISFTFFSCVRVYTLGGKATIHILNEKGEPFKKEDGVRFEVRNIRESGYYPNIEKEELTYVLNVYVSGKSITVSDNENIRKMEEAILLHKLKITEGIVIIDKNGEYKPKFQYLVNATIKNKTPNDFFGNHYEFEDFVILEKK